MVDSGFVVDAMLGKVALWLRLVGEDTLYSPDIQDDTLLSIAQREGRILLTSDADLHKRALELGIIAMLVRGSVDARVASVFRAFDIKPDVDPSKSRCSKCNGELLELKENEKHLIKNLVYNNTYNYYDRFWLCKGCNNVYFQGGYWDNIVRYMDKIRSILKD